LKPSIPFATVRISTTNIYFVYFGGILSYRNDDNWPLYLVICIVATITTFSQIFGLDFLTGLKVLGYSVGSIIGWVCSKNIFDKPFGNTWPIASSAIWYSWWPALDHWSDSSSPAAFVKEGIADQMWYATNYTKYGALIVIIGGGYCLRSWLNNKIEERALARFIR
jgi:hypothetical protein